MRTYPVRTTVAAALVAMALPAAAGPERIDWPRGFEDDFVLYLQVDRHDRNRVRFVFVNPETDGQAKAGEPLPDGTVLIMAVKDAQLDAGGQPVIGEDGRFVPTGAFTNVFVMEKGAGWGADRPPALRNGVWDYAWFLPDGTLKADAQYDGCFACHAYRAERDFTFTYAKFLIDQGR
jgi:hypothetical protein